MTFFSSLLGMAFLFVSLCFALSNRQSVTVSLWPFDIAITAPLFLLTLGFLLMGLLLGGVMVWFSCMPHRLAARRLRKDVTRLEKEVGTLQQQIIPPTPHTPHILRSLAFWKRHD